MFIQTKRLLLFFLTKIIDIKNILISLLDEIPLNGVKYLDYLAFKQAINIKLDTLVRLSDKLELITQIKSSMNSKRVNFTYAFFDSHNKNNTLLIIRSY